MNNLNQDCIRSIFSYLEPHDLGNCCQVKSFMKIASEDRFWEKIVPDELADIDKKKYLDDHALTSYKGIVDRITHFINKGPKNCDFFCNFPFNEKINLSVYSRQNKRDEITAETYIFMKKLLTKLKPEFINSDPLDHIDLFLNRISMNHFNYTILSNLPDIENPEINNIDPKIQIQQGLIAFFNTVQPQMELRRRNVLLGGIAAIGLGSLYGLFGSKH
jgi:hypothetical protein